MIPPLRPGRKPKENQLPSLRDIQTRLKQAQGELSNLHCLCESSLEQISDLADEQREAFDNMPENLQSSERGQAAEARADRLEEIKEAIESALSDLESAISDMEVE